MLLYIFVSIIYLIYINIISTKSLHMLQQNRYNRGYKYVKWLLKNLKENFVNYNLLFVLFILFYFSENLLTYINYIAILLFIFLIFVFISNKKKETTKIPLKYTARIKRLIATNTLLHILLIIITLLNYSDNNLPLYYFILGLIGYLNPLVIILINFLNRPVEKMVANHFRNQAINKLNRGKKLIKK